MKIIMQVSTAFIVTLLLGCSSQSSDTTKSRNKDSIINNNITTTSVYTPRSFLKNYGANDSNRLFVFVGEKISVEPLPHERGSMDKRFIVILITKGIIEVVNKPVKQRLLVIEVGGLTACKR